MNEEIREWLNGQHAWLKEASFRLLTNGAITDDDLPDLLELIKNPSAEDRTYNYPAIGASGSESVLKLVSVGPVVGVDALNPKTPLPLNEDTLTVVYGDNGSGKSGYVRLLKRLSGKANAPDLKSNVFQEEPGTRECTIAFEVDGESKEAVWQVNSTAMEELRVIDVFDTHSGSVYLSGETDLSYSPPELSFFSELVEVSKRLEAKLKEESNELRSELPNFQQVHAGSKWINRYGKLRHDVTEEQIASFTKWENEDDKALDELKKRLTTTDPVAEAKKRRTAKQQAGTLRNEIASFKGKLGTHGIERLKGLLNEAASKRKEAGESVAAFTENAKLGEVGSETWRALWLAAREYSTQAYPEKPYPFTDNESRCVLCHQELDADAKQRLTDFESYVSSKLETDAKKSEVLLNNAIDSLINVPNSELLSTKCKAAELPDEFCQKLEELYADLRIVLSLVREKKFEDDFPEVEERANQAEAVLGELEEALEKAALKFDEYAKLLDHEKTRKDLIEQEARKWVSEQKEAIETEVKRLAKVQVLAEAIARTSTARISRKAGELSETLITAAYVDRFNEELTKLGAARVQVELVRTRTQQGRSKHQIQLLNLHHPRIKPSEILSEGEHRIVALAAFLADVTGKSANVPFVFDDPITSLSQNYEEKVAARLVELSSSRQVIVFTHRLSLLGNLSNSSTPSAIHVRREPWGTGQPGDVPIFGKSPQKALNSLKSDRLVRARRELEQNGYEAYYPHAKALCSDFRILVERIVELTLLADVIQRHRRAINTLNKIDKLAKITADDCSRIESMMSKYSAYEHSQSSESPVDVPEPDELLEDLDAMISWHEEFVAR